MGVHLGLCSFHITATLFWLKETWWWATIYYKQIIPDFKRLPEPPSQKAPTKCHVHYWALYDMLYSAKMCCKSHFKRIIVWMLFNIFFAYLNWRWATC